MTMRPEFSCKTPDCPETVQYIPKLEDVPLQIMFADSDPPRRVESKTIYLTCAIGHAHGYLVVD